MCLYGFDIFESIYKVLYDDMNSDLRRPDLTPLNTACSTSPGSLTHHGDFGGGRAAK